MQIVLRPVNDHFLREVIFPAFEVGVMDAAAGFDHLSRHLIDQQSVLLLEQLTEGRVDGSFFGFNHDKWNDLLYRVLFFEWEKHPTGWVIGQPHQGYAAPWEESFHVTLMLEDLAYPYHDADRADAHRRQFWARPNSMCGLATLMTGTWDPFPKFPPDQVLTMVGGGMYEPRAGIARADWSWRPMLTVSQWAARLPNVLAGLLEREVKRLKPIDVPEKHEILDFWLGRTPEPPLLAVSFSGLGPRTSEWIQEIGTLARLLRNTARKQYGLTAVLSRSATTSGTGNTVDD